MSRLRTNRVCFTLNNYELEDIEAFENFIDNDNGIVYAIVGQEIGEQGTPHLQGFVHYNEDRKKCGINFWKNKLPNGKRAHFEAARGTDEQNKAYCEKDGIYIEKGEPASHTDKWSLIFETAKTDWKAAAEICPEFSLKYINNLKTINHNYGAPRRS